MKKIILLLQIIILSAGSSAAQSYFHGFNPNPSGEITDFQAGDSLKILAVIVEFQEDKYNATYGNGKLGSIYTQAYGDTIMDPLPHDAQYFSDHLLFAKNYFEKVSKGKLKINSTVLEQVFTVSKTMREYTPGYRSDDLTPLGNFAEEVWTQAGDFYPDFNFSDYDLFVIFHAGVSSGLDLGTSDLDRNMPSVYLSPVSLKNIFGNNFQGFSVGNNSYLINNSILLPETESRELDAVDGSKILLELTINGAIVANIASYLGLPDLFNTETGLSVIGRFGLMDGQAIIANYGMFPPEPSAWEKIFLGWEIPKTVEFKDQSIKITASETAQSNDTTIVKVPINTSEYYLVENRQQDANKDQANIKIKVGGEIKTKTIYKDTSGFYLIYPDSIDGVVIDVDEFDMAVPGSGIVIWHIDDKVIQENINSNTINNDKNYLGVDVEEADGIQDIGEQFSSFLGTSIGEGTLDDLWYASNPSQLYVNKFSNDTNPNTKSNSGGNSLITFNNFSESMNQMTFDLSFGENNLKLLLAKQTNIPAPIKSIAPVDENGELYLYLQSENILYKYDIEGNFVESFNNFSDYNPVVVNQNNSHFLIGSEDSKVNIVMYSDGISSFIQNDIGEKISSVPVVRKTSGGTFILLIGTENGNLKEFLLNDLINQTAGSVNSSESIGNQPVKYIAADGDYSCFASTNYFSDVNEVITQVQDDIKKLVLTKDRIGSYTSVLLTEGNKFYIIKQNSIVEKFEVNSQVNINSFVVADLFGDSENYILFNNKNELAAYNLNGEPADNYPTGGSLAENLTGTPVIAELNGDDFTDIISVAEDGRIDGFSGADAKIIDGFPLAGTTGLSSTPGLFSFTDTSGENKSLLFTSDIEGNLNIWQIAGEVLSISWTGEYADQHNSSFVVQAASDNTISEFFPESRAYNYPNPVYGSETNIRYYVRENSQIKIRIFDLAGDLVAELNDNAAGGFDNETTWNVSNIQSGVYFAHIEATSASGKSGSKIIKIAVVK